MNKFHKMHLWNPNSDYYHITVYISISISEWKIFLKDCFPISQRKHIKIWGEMRPNQPIPCNHSRSKRGQAGREAGRVENSGYTSYLSYFYTSTFEDWKFYTQSGFICNKNIAHQCTNMRYAHPLSERAKQPYQAGPSNTISSSPSNLDQLPCSKQQKPTS